ncbi:alpha/beta fold hydrolase [Micromonospora sp. NPDC006766]|uniref:alpha/beta fold hydrolase n=1 Tax=Micromonospora sp. NPDC006766 TaxID=3154778 RepID=UPI0033D23E1D
MLRGLGFSPVTFDAPGHGDSGGTSMTILEYEEVIRHLQGRYGRFEAVIAHSFGVPCALHDLRNGIGAGRLVAVSGVAEFGFLVDEFSRQLGLSGRVQQEGAAGTRPPDHRRARGPACRHPQPRASRDPGPAGGNRRSHGIHHRRHRAPRSTCSRRARWAPSACRERR